MLTVFVVCMRVRVPVCTCVCRIRHQLCSFEWPCVGMFATSALDVIYGWANGCTRGDLLTSKLLLQQGLGGVQAGSMLLEYDYP